MSRTLAASIVVGGRYPASDSNIHGQANRRLLRPERNKLAWKNRINKEFFSSFSRELRINTPNRRRYNGETELLSYTQADFRNGLGPRAIVLN
jgi:hypothetical protein